MKKNLKATDILFIEYFISCLLMFVLDSMFKQNIYFNKKKFLHMSKEKQTCKY